MPATEEYTAMEKAMGARRMTRGISLLALGLMLASCGGGEKEAPKGQVVATVDGKEITTSELRLEMGDAGGDPKANPNAQSAALQGLIARKLLANEARERGLDKSPMAAMMRARAEEMALVQLLQMNIAGTVPKVSDDEVNNYVSAHPHTFSQRRLISVDQLLIGQIDPKVIQQMEPLKTMAEVEKLLNDNKVQFVRSAAVMDTLNLNPEAAEKISQLGGDEVIVMPSGSGIQVARITGSRIEPVAGEEAQRLARAMLMRQRGAMQVRQSLEKIVKDGQSKVNINEAYKAKGGAQPTAAASDKAN